MPKVTQIRVWFAIVGIALVAQSCREDEQNRPLMYDKGAYHGQQDEALTEEAVDTLRQRSTQQKY
ncbi:MAG: hypothetical protein ACREIR_16735 [Geminicoccaceae bacterium]